MAILLRRRVAALFVAGVAAVALTATTTGGTANASAFGGKISLYEATGSNYDCMDVMTEDGIHNNNAEVQDWTCTGADEQHWSLAGDGSRFADGNFREEIVNGASNKCLIPGSGDRSYTLVQWSCSPSFGRWQLLYWPLDQHSFTYKIEWNDSNQCITVQDHTIANRLFYHLAPCTATPAIGSKTATNTFSTQVFWVQANLAHGGPDR